MLVTLIFSMKLLKIRAISYGNVFNGPLLPSLKLFYIDNGPYIAVETFSIIIVFEKNVHHSFDTNVENVHLPLIHPERLAALRRFITLETSCTTK